MISLDDLLLLLHGQPARRPRCRYFHLFDLQGVRDAAGPAASRPGTQLVVDAGCQWGHYSLYAASHGFRVLCFEVKK